MADNDDQESALTLADPGSYPDSGSEESKEPAPPAQPAQEAESSEGAPEDPGIAKNRQAYIERLEHNYWETAGREQEMMAGMGKSIDSLNRAINAPPPKPPVPYALPAPPSEQYKGGLGEFIFQLLKFGAIAAIAFGTGRRGYAHGALWKGAIAEALNGYYKGRKDASDQAMHLWEKNREVINEANKRQTELYKENMAQSKLTLSQRMALNNQVAAAYRDYRMYQATKNQNITEINSALRDQERSQKDNERWVRKNRDQLYNILGQPGQTARYWAWVNKQSGGKVNITHTSSEQDIEKAEKEYPISKFLEYQQEQEIKKAGEKSEAEAKGRKKGEAEAEQPPDQGEQAKKDAAQKKVDEITAKILPGL